MFDVCHIIISENRHNLVNKLGKVHNAAHFPEPSHCTTIDSLLLTALPNFDEKLTQSRSHDVNKEQSRSGATSTSARRKRSETANCPQTNVETPIANNCAITAASLDAYEPRLNMQNCTRNACQQVVLQQRMPKQVLQQRMPTRGLTTTTPSLPQSAIWLGSKQLHKPASVGDLACTSQACLSRRSGLGPSKEHSTTTGHVQ